MKNIIKSLCIIAFGVTCSLTVLYILTNRSMEFKFANEGRIICTDTRDYGLFPRGDLKCFAVVPLFQPPQPTPTPQRVDSKGEIILSK